MKTINKNNYQEFFLQYMEGTLPQDLLGELLVFVDQNPDLKEEFEGLEMVVLEPESDFVFEEKSLLKHFSGKVLVDENNIDVISIALLEGDLEPETASSVKKQLELNSEWNQSYEIYKKTRLQPDYQVIYTDKKSLKHKTEINRRPLYYSISAAASVIIIMGLLLLMPGKKDPNHQIANKHEQIVKKSDSSASIKNIINNSQVADNKLLKKKESTLRSKIKKNAEPELLIANAMDKEKRQDAEEYLEQKDSVPKIDDLTTKDLVAISNPVLTTVSSNKTHSESKYLTIGELVKKEAEKVVGREPLKNIVHPERPETRIWELVSLGTNAIGKITNNRVETYKNYDEEGNLAAISFKAGSYQYSKKIE